MNPPILAVTMGDPGGAGPEVTVKALQKLKHNLQARIVVTGGMAVFEALKAKLKIPFKINPVPSYEAAARRPAGIYFLDAALAAERLLPGVSRLPRTPVDIGRATKRNAVLAWAALELAAKAAARGSVQAIVTAPVNKTAMRLVRKDFHGHTEYLAETSKSRSFAMMFVSDRLKVTLATIHVPLAKVASIIKPALVDEKIRLTDQFLKSRFKIKRPRIAVCALNPHGKETGTEDERLIRPGVNRARAAGVNAEGPLSADQLFHDAYEGRFDAVIAMYHDQGLAPFKMIAFRDGVNVTLGLPYVRTSPDHGTAYDIAWQGKADPASMLSALNLALKLTL